MIIQMQAEISAVKNLPHFWRQKRMFWKKWHLSAFCNLLFIIHKLTMDIQFQVDSVPLDLLPQQLHSRVGDDFGCAYLSEYQSDADETKGIVWLRSGQLLVNLPVSKNDGKSLAVFFLVDTRSPLTYLSKQAIDLLGGRSYQSYSGQFNVDVWGQTTWV